MVWIRRLVGAAMLFTTAASGVAQETFDPRGIMSGPEFREAWKTVGLAPDSYSESNARR